MGNIYAGEIQHQKFLVEKVKKKSQYRDLFEDLIKYFSISGLSYLPGPVFPHSQFMGWCETFCRLEQGPLHTVDFEAHLNAWWRKQQGNNVQRTFLPSVRRWLSWFNSFFSVCDSNSQVCDIYFSIHVLAVLFTFLCFSLADIPQLHKSGGRGWLACCCCGDLSLNSLCW